MRPALPDWHTTLALAAGLLVIPQALLLARVIDALFLANAGRSAVLAPLAWLVLVSAARAGLGWLAETGASAAAGRTRRDLRSTITTRILDAGPRWLDHERTGATTATLAGGVEALEAYLAAYRPQVRLAIVIPAGVLLTVAWVDPLSGAVLLVTGPLIPLFMWLLGSAARERTEQQWQELARLGARFLDAVQGLVTLRAFGRVEAEAATLHTASDRFRTLTMDVLRVAFLSSLALELLATLGTAIVAVEVGLRLLYDWISFAEALAVLLLAPEFYRPLRTLGTSFHAGMAGRETLRQLAAIETQLDAAAAISPAAPSGSGPPLPAPPTLTFDGVVMAYDDARATALGAVTVTAAAGECLGIAGPTGAGKSSLLQAVLRFRPPAAGRIVIDGRPLDEWPPDAWRRHVSWAPQRPHLFHGTVRDNLCLGHPSASDAEIARVLDLAAFDEVVARLPRGLETRVGEQGVGLSGGEAQRLALARAYLKRAPVLLLDEPTADLDLETEARVLDGLREARQGRTVLLVSHRATTLRAADRVLTLPATRPAS
ncbi:MAG: thiol reductant ABC exporter subunit CydD [Vicinamibacterales bacterium]|nr:thiol reductant ABC exporter subunit CydD [Vicinamibacterales bacterium]